MSTLTDLYAAMRDAEAPKDHLQDSIRFVVLDAMQVALRTVIRTGRATAAERIETRLEASKGYVLYPAEKQAVERLIRAARAWSEEHGD